MSLSRRNPRRDKGEPAIVEALRKMGWSVEHLSGKGCPDLIAGIGPWTLVLIEVKGAKGKLTEDQIAWLEKWRGPKPLLLRSVDEAIALSNRVFRGESPWT